MVKVGKWIAQAQNTDVDNWSFINYSVSNRHSKDESKL